MNTITEKRIYIMPLIERVKLDNEISLILVSGDPLEPDVVGSLVPEYFNNDPFKTMNA